MKVTNLLFWVQDNTLSQSFYKKLGFDVVRSDDQHSVVSLGNFEIALVTMRDEEEFSKDSLNPEKGRGMYVYIQVDDVDKTFVDLKTKDFAPATEPRDWPWGNREFILKDPDGYKLCFWTKVS